MAQGGTVITPGAAGTNGWNRTSYKAGFEDATYQEMVFTDTIDDYGTKLLGTGTVRKHARASGTVLAQDTGYGQDLTASNIVASPVSITPVGRYVLVAWSRNEKAQVDADLMGEGGKNIRRAMAETLDTAGLASIQSLTQTMSQASIDGAMWRQAVGRLMGNTNGEAMPGDIKGIFSHTQYPNLLAIDEFTHADVRGDSENPEVKGIFTKGGGVNVRFSTVIAQDGNGWHNAIYIPSAFVVGWNEDISLKEEEDELLYRVIAYANNGYSVQHDLRAIAMRSTASAL